MKNKTLYLENATYIDWQTFDFKQSDIKVEEGINNKIEFIDSIPETASNIIDCTGKYVTKSFALGHHHIYSALACGMPAPEKSPADFHEILKYIWWNIDKKLDKEMIKASALTTAIECAKAGSTYVIDHHASPNYIEGSLDIISNAFAKIGVSHLLCYEISDRDGIERANKGLFENENYLKKNPGLVGLHASFTVGDETLRKAAEIVAKYQSGIHIHVAEDKLDQELCEKNHNKRVVERLNDYGLLNYPKTILAHAIHVTENERNIIRNSSAYLVQNPESNQNNNVGFFTSKSLGDRIMLGTDGMHSDMLRTAKVALFAGTKYENQSYETIYKRFRNTHNYLNNNNFTGDGDNNLIVLDYKPRTDFNKNNFLGHFIFGINTTDIQHVISNGKLIVKNREITTANEKEIYEFAREQSIKLWEKL